MCITSMFSLNVALLVNLSLNRSLCTSLKVIMFVNPVTDNGTKLILMIQIIMLIFRSVQFKGRKFLSHSD